MARKSADLNRFNLFQYLNEQYSFHRGASFFLANEETYRDASINFPFRTFSYGIGLTYSGAGGKFRIGSVDYDIPPGSLVTVGPGIISQWTGDYNSKHETVYFTEELFTSSFQTSFIKSLPFFLPGGNHVLQLDEACTNKVKVLLDTIKLFTAEQEAVPGIIYALLLFITKCHSRQSGNISSAGTPAEKLARDFKALVGKHFTEQKDVQFYASRLNITPRYLSEVLQNETGQTAKVLIQEHLFLEAKSLLRQTSMTVQQICNWLGYSDHSYFTKAFKKKEGCTPMAYRSL